MSYNEKAVDALEPFNRLRERTYIPFDDQRMMNGITNALTMLVEEKGWNERVFEHLSSALIEQVNSLQPQNKDLCSTLEICLVEVKKHR